MPPTSQLRLESNRSQPVVRFGGFHIPTFHLCRSRLEFPFAECVTRNELCNQMAGGKAMACLVVLFGLERGFRCDRGFPALRVQPQNGTRLDSTHK
jgi:hypothetical protein